VLASQTAATVFAAPAGATGAPTFRALVAGDIPTLTASKISDFATTAQGYRLDQFAVPTSDVSFNSRKITSLADPTNAQDAATKAYVDAARSGLDVKASVRAATTANITLSGTQTIDGVALSAGDRVLVKNQSTASQNGIYVVAAGAWARSTDADSDTEVTPGLFTFVEEGTANSDSGWVLATNSTITLGSTSLTFAQFSGAGQITAGDGLTKDGNTLNVATASTSRIVVNADNIDLASGVATAGTYQAVTVDTYGRVTSGTNPTTLSGYGITDALSTSSDIDGGSYP
jgi:phage-related tail fiber protein